MPAELISFLPTLNALLNATSGILLTVGFIFIRRRNVQPHRASMIPALVSSARFLISYLVYHYHAGTTRFAGTGAARLIYFVILTTHTILAAVMLVRRSGLRHNGYCVALH